MVRTFPTLGEAHAAAGPDEMVNVAGDIAVKAGRIQIQGNAVFYLAPRDATEHELSLLAFEARNGKPHPDPRYVGWLIDEANQ